ncbi:metal-sulfur cluster assembly factor [Bradyrhizobium sp.]|uniref:metal-sulfur cluster assembly factor n=1 Tax=Bradyrhizobium sp. TaxID=376 RepID=UPI002736B0B0|nr:metal-sulfur cluster assembly factor [Bradyrhizobium sp.]MDP3691513.1 metal-sulfur cluster assembly factor [Bradyrhizobium sp.]
MREALRVVIDPELGESIVDLGFIYDIAVADGVVSITMTATTPGCPAAGFLKESAQAAASAVPGVVSADVTMTFEPAWDPSRIAPAVRVSLGFAAVN